LNDWNDWNKLSWAAVSNMPDLIGRKWRLARGIACILDWLFHSEKTHSKPLDRAIYTIFYRLINGLRWATRRKALGPSTNSHRNVCASWHAFWWRPA